MGLQKHLWGTSSWLQASWNLGVTPAPGVCGEAENLPRSGQPAWFPGDSWSSWGWAKVPAGQTVRGAKQLHQGRVPTSLRLVIPTQRTAGEGHEMEMTLGSDIQVPWTMEQCFQMQETAGLTETSDVREPSHGRSVGQMVDTGPFFQTLGAVGQ